MKSALSAREYGRKDKRTKTWRSVSNAGKIYTRSQALASKDGKTYIGSETQGKYALDFKREKYECDVKSGKI